MNRRNFIKGLGLTASSLVVAGAVTNAVPAFAQQAKEPNNLRFSRDGKFKIMEMSDIQDFVRTGQRPTMDQRTIVLMNAALDAEKPNLVVINGDHLGGDMNAKELQEYLRQMVAPLEQHQVPWMVVFGNHDEDAVTAIKEDGWTKVKILSFLQKFKYNVNRSSMSGATKNHPNGINTYAVGDMYHLIYDNAGTKPLYNIWAMDTNSHTIGSAIGDFDRLLAEQIQWYYNTALDLRKQHGNLNAIMFLHIPTPEFELMYRGQGNDVIGSRYGTEFSTVANGGIFSTVKFAGDVKGIFAAHAHENDYVGSYNGISLSFDGSVGYFQYGPDMFVGNDKQYVDVRDLLRGVRMIELDVKNLDTFTTRMVYATDLGVNYTTAELGQILRQYGQYVVTLQDKANVNVCGWVTNAAGETTYIDPAGDLQTGWLTIASKFTYYFNEKGVMQKGWQKIGNNNYYFGTDGKMVSNTRIDGYEIGKDGVRK